MTSPPDRPEPPQTSGHLAGWPSRISELARELRGQPPDEKLRGEFWLLLNSVLQQRIRIESRRTGPIGEEDLSDLASEKSLDLMNQFDAGKWRPDSSAREHVVAFISTVARNGLIDALRRSSRRPTDAEGDMDAPHVGAAGTSQERPDTRVERAEIVEALVDCAESLQSIHRAAWIFRVFLDMPSKTIARHPEIKRESSHVDVILQRCRDSMSNCMRQKGHDVSSLPTGSFTALWRAFRLDELSIKDATDNA